MLIQSKIFFPKEDEDMAEDENHNLDNLPHLSKTFALAETDEPEEPNEGEKEEVFSDHFLLRCDHIDIQPKSIILPKFIFGPGLGYKEKGFLFLEFDSDHKNNLYSKMLKAATTGFSKFEIDFLDSETKLPISTWKFVEARVQAVDFGFVAVKRTEPADPSLEIDFKHLIIGDTGV